MAELHNADHPGSSPPRNSAGPIPSGRYKRTRASCSEAAQPCRVRHQRVPCAQRKTCHRRRRPRRCAAEGIFCGAWRLLTSRVEWRPACRTIVEYRESTARRDASERRTYIGLAHQSQWRIVSGTQHGLEHIDFALVKLAEKRRPARTVDEAKFKARHLTDQRQHIHRIAQRFTRHGVIEWWPIGQTGDRQHGMIGDHGPLLWRKRQGLCHRKCQLAGRCGIAGNQLTVGAIDINAALGIPKLLRKPGG